MAKNLDIKKVKHAAQHAVPLSVKTYTLPHETEVYVEEILTQFLKELDQDTIKDPLAYCLKELMVNAKKANTKRVYFKEKGYNIEDDAEYSEGMENFKDETLENIDYYLEKQNEQDYYIKVIFHFKENVLQLSVGNNAEITKKEQMRVYDRIARSRAFNSLEEALTTVLDDSEGAGLGIVILVLMLKKLGLSEDSFDIDTENGETIARLNIPISQVKLEQLQMLAEQIVKEIDALPQFPENIVYLQELLDDPDTELSDIARQISVDPSLTADLLKLVNSAQFMLPKKVDNIVEAVKLVGVKGLKNLLYTYGTRKVLNNISGNKKALWDHSYKTAFYAYSIARSLLKNKRILDDVYVGGILHDMGKIIFASVHPNLLEKIDEYCKEKEIPREVFEDMSGGINHSEIGAKIAENWNFPDPLINAIRYHHVPGSAPPEYREVVYTVYLANAIANIEEEVISADQVDTQILKDMGITSESQLMKVLEKLKQAFDRQEM